MEWGGGDPETRVRKAGGCCGDGGGGVEWWRVGGGIVQFQRKQQRFVPTATWGGVSSIPEELATKIGSDGNFTTPDSVVFPQSGLPGVPRLPLVTKSYLL